MQLLCNRAELQTDAQLLQCFVAERDQTAFEELLRRHGSMVLRVCRRVLGHHQDAEDAFQAAFVVLTRKASAVAKMQSISGWLHGTAYRVALQAKRHGNVARVHAKRMQKACRPDDSQSRAGADLVRDEARAAV